MPLHKYLLLTGFFVSCFLLFLFFLLFVLFASLSVSVTDEQTDPGEASGQ